MTAVLCKRYYALWLKLMPLINHKTHVWNFSFLLMLLSWIEILVTEIPFISGYKNKPNLTSRAWRNLSFKKRLTDRAFRHLVINGYVSTVTHFRLFTFVLSCQLIVDSSRIELPITPCFRIFDHAPPRHPG